MGPVSTWSSIGTWATFPNQTFRNDYMGVQVQKCEQDLERYRELVDISQPDIVIETGSRDGGSALWFNQELDLQVVSIDIVRPNLDKLPIRRNHAGIEFLVGSSISDWVFETLLKHIRGKRVMVSLDSDHHSSHVQAEIARLGALVSKGCYLVVEDACFDVWAREGKLDQARVGGSKIPEFGGPLDAIEKQLLDPRTRRAFRPEQQIDPIEQIPGQMSRHFWRDTELEGLTPISHSPCGWWRRND